MIAYNKSWLYNVFVRKECLHVFEQHCISKEEKEAIWAAHAVSFYSPNIFIRIGLYLLTLVVTFFSFGILALAFMGSIEKYYGGLLVFFSVVLFAALEFMIHKKHHYQSGVDDALLTVAAISLFCGISLPFELSGLGNSILVFLIGSGCAIRYADRLMAALAIISCLAIAFFLCSRFGGILKAIMPFIIMALSLVIYFSSKKITNETTFSVYKESLVIIEIVSLFTFYFAGNYWVVRELSNEMFQLNLQPGQTIPFGYIFWCLTLLVPLVYLALGLFKKDVVLMRVGLLLITAIVFTVRYYYEMLDAEILMLTGGAIMILLAWILTRYLQTPKYGFTSEEGDSKNVMDKWHIESLVLAETFSQQPNAADDHQFGGGDFGGGGATNDF